MFSGTLVHYVQAVRTSWKRYAGGLAFPCGQTVRLSWKGNEWPGQGGGCGDWQVCTSTRGYYEQTVRERVACPCTEDSAERETARVVRPHRARGRAVQVEPIKLTLEAPGIKRLKLKFDPLLSILLQFCFQIQLAPLQRGTVRGAGRARAADGVRLHVFRFRKLRDADGGDERHPGRAVQVDPIKPTLLPTGTKRLKVRYDGPLSSVAFKFNLRCYNLEATRYLPQVYASYYASGSGSLSYLRLLLSVGGGVGVGPLRYCSPRHTIPFNSRFDDSKHVDDVVSLGPGRHSSPRYEIPGNALRNKGSQCGG